MESARNRGYFAPQGWLPTPGLRVASDRPTGGAHGVKKIRCAIYTRKSAEEGLEQDFNSLDAQREACAAYVASQKAEGWVLLPTVYEDAGLSGGTLERPRLQRLLDDIDAGLVEQIVVYKVDRLTRSLSDFAKLVERLEAAGVVFVSATPSCAKTRLCLLFIHPRAPNLINLGSASTMPA